MKNRLPCDDENRINKKMKLSNFRFYSHPRIANRVVLSGIRYMRRGRML